jgi:glycosyltransferase involved in cell wall biosynthesis
MIIGTGHQPKIIFVCGREPQYPRNTMLWRTIQQNFDGRLVGESGGTSLSWRISRLVPRLAAALRYPHDLVVVGFFGHPFVPIVRMGSKAPVLFDPFVSAYDTLVSDRKVVRQGSMLAYLLFKLDKTALSRADRILTDTLSHGIYYQEQFGVSTRQQHNLYLGADEQLFYPHSNFRKNSHFTVFTYSTYMPLHGVDTIIRAARLCQSYPIEFRLVGDTGPTYDTVRKLAADLNLANVIFLPTLPLRELATEISRADICLGGHFGPTEKARRVIAGKTYQFMAMAKPTVVGDTPANRELFQHMDTAYFCAPNNPKELATAIVNLFENPDLTQEIACRAYELFQGRLTWSRLGTKLARIIQSML